MLSNAKDTIPSAIKTYVVTKGDSMPLVRIDLAEGRSLEYGKQVGQIIYRALTDVMNAPKDDLFQIITEHPQFGLQFDREFLGVHRSDACIFAQITLNSGRTVEMKQRFYKAVADGLHESLKLRREDIFISLVEVTKENWSFGNGEAQYAPATP
jgi:4-oxalocrotonate tautomerase